MYSTKQKYEKPLPIPDLETKEFWAACKRRELHIQRCQQCGTYRFPPRPICHRCRSSSFEWAKLSGKGKVYSFIVVHQATHPAFQEDVPYAVVLVEVDEAKGVKMAGNVIDCPPDQIKIGMPVEATFKDVTDEITLVYWKRIPR